VRLLATVRRPDRPVRQRADAETIGRIEACRRCADGVPPGVHWLLPYLNVLVPILTITG
jgi:hypothetical protein